MGVLEILVIILGVSVSNLIFVATGYYICSRSRIINVIEGKQAQDNNNEFKISDLLNRVKKSEYTEEEAYVPRDRSEAIY